jgi:hypothetical protein
VDAIWAPKYATAAALWGSLVLVPIIVMGVAGVVLTLLARAVGTRPAEPEAAAAPAP